MSNIAFILNNYMLLLFIESNTC